MDKPITDIQQLVVCIERMSYHVQGMGVFLENFENEWSFEALSGELLQHAPQCS